MVIYSDGGSYQCNPAPCGGGVHGYIYDAIPNKKGIGLAKTTVTQGGYITNDIIEKNKLTLLTEYDITEEDLHGSIKDFSQYDKDKKKPVLYQVTIKEYCNFLKPNDGVGTNNQAELLGMITALKFFLKSSIKYALIYTDSQYVLNNITKKEEIIEKNYITSTNKEISNKDLVIEVFALLDQIKANNQYVYFRWIAGHSGFIGNEMSDKMATMAAAASNHLKLGYRENNDTVDLSTTDTPFKNDKTHHPLLAMDRFYFNPAHDRSQGKYYLSNLGDKEEDTHIGKEVADASLAIVSLQENDSILEYIKDTQQKWLSTMMYNLDVLVAGFLSNITTSTFYNELIRYKDYFIKSSDRKRPDLFLLDSKNKPLTLVLDPPFLSMRTLNQFQILEQRANAILDKSYKGEIIDITDYFFHTEKKYTLKSEIDGKIKYIDIPIDYKGEASPANSSTRTGKGKVKIRLTFNIDIVNRNTLKRLESFHPTISLLVWSKDDVVIEYATMIQLNTGEWCIQMASYANNKILLK